MLLGQTNEVVEAVRRAAICERWHPLIIQTFLMFGSAAACDFISLKSKFFFSLFFSSFSLPSLSWSSDAVFSARGQIADLSSHS